MGVDIFVGRLSTVAVISLSTRKILGSDGLLESGMVVLVFLRERESSYDEYKQKRIIQYRNLFEIIYVVLHTYSYLNFLH